MLDAYHKLLLISPGLIQLRKGFKMGALLYNRKKKTVSKRAIRGIATIYTHTCMHMHSSRNDEKKIFFFNDEKRLED